MALSKHYNENPIRNIGDVLAAVSSSSSLAEVVMSLDLRLLPCPYPLLLYKILLGIRHLYTLRLLL